MKKDEFYKLYWRQYQLLEKEVLDTDAYVTIEGKNSAAFSAQYVKLFLNLCSEIDTLAEQLREMIAEKHEDCDIDTKGPTILKKIAAVKIEFEKLGEMYVITKAQYDSWKNIPFLKFDDTSSDSWWRDYNLVKHYRNEMMEGSNKYNYEKANLKNTLKALSAFYLLCCLTNQFLDENAPDLKSEIFETGYGLIQVREPRPEPMFKDFVRPVIIRVLKADNRVLGAGGTC